MVRKGTALLALVSALFLAGCSAEEVEPPIVDDKPPVVENGELKVEYTIKGNVNYIGVEDHPSVKVFLEGELFYVSEPWTGSTYLNEEYSDSVVVELPKGSHSFSVSVVYRFGSYGGPDSQILYNPNNLSDCSISLDGRLMFEQSVEYPALIGEQNGQLVKYVQNGGLLFCEYAGTIVVN